MVRTCSEDGGQCTLQEDNLLAARRYHEERKAWIKVARLGIKRSSDLGSGYMMEESTGYTSVELNQGGHGTHGAVAPKKKM